MTALATLPEPSTVVWGRVGLSDGRYTLQRELACGGMGRVWLADDARLSRRVAIKELLQPDARLQARFARELSLTARLEHPSIVSVHDSGTWPDGTPFYVMKLVDGEPLDRALERTMSLADRLALLPHGVAAVEAVAYAHAQGIVHRDLKPANVLIGAYGETVVIDWGLAKDLHAPAIEREAPQRYPLHVGATVGGEILGTPAYMAPEQALGDAVDERADVYALGAMLDHLLSGAAPYRGGSVDEVLANVISGPPAPLTTRAPGVSVDLVAIIEKAMARRPEDRYANAAALAIDLKRFLSGQLVGARRYTSRQLLWRWLRRHRAVVGVAAAAIVALAVLGVVSFTRIMREQRETQTAWRSAEQHHAEAEALVGFMLVDLNDKLKPLGRLDLLESVAVRARDYYRAQPNAKTLDEEDGRARALHGLALVLAAKGDIAGAVAEHEAALDIRRRIAAVDPKRWANLATSYTLFAEAVFDRGDFDAALAAHQRALAINELLVASAPDDPAALARLASSRSNLGDLYFTARREDSVALREHRRALAIHERLVAMAPDNLERQRALVESRWRVGQMLMHTGQFAQALVDYKRTLELANAIVAHDPADAISQNFLATAHEGIASAHGNLGELAPALDHFRKSLAIRERLAANDPIDAKLRSAVASTRLDIGQVTDELGKLDEALEQYRVAENEIEQLVRSDAKNARLQLLHGHSQRLVGFTLLRQGHDDAGIAALERSRATIEKVGADHPDNKAWQKDLIPVYSDLAYALLERDVPKALALQRRALELAERMAARDPKSTSSQADIVDMLVHLAGMLDDTGAVDEARATYRRALAVSEAIDRQSSANAKLTGATAKIRELADACCKKRRAGVSH